jgi:hypothetical protein
MRNRMIRPLALSAAIGVAGVFGTHWLHGETPPPAKPAEAAKPAPITFTNEVVATRTAVTPKPLSESVQKGLAYLIKNQQDDGGWNQGGGWRTAIQNAGGGRIEGKDVEDPSDVGNTCVALLALIRAGSTPTDGDHKDAVKKGLRYLFTKVEKAKADDLYVTDVRNTQLQSKIGPYIDTFMANLVLAELKGKAGEDDKRLIACLEKTMNKIVKNQTADGQFAGNGGWAPVLSVAVANKGIARAQQAGVQVDQMYFARAAEQSKNAVAGIAPATSVGAGTIALGTTGPATSTPALRPPVATKPAGESIAIASPVPAPSIGGRAAYTSGLGGGGAGGAGDAGVSLYRIAQGASNYQDVVNSMKVDADKAKKVLEDAKATKEQRDIAQKTVEDFKKAEDQNGEIQKNLAANVKNEQFVAGFGSNGGEEFLSFLNISETLVLKGGKEWDEWDGKMKKGLEKAQDKDGSWAGHHCITGKTFCTAGAVLVMLADRTPFPVDMLDKKTEKKDDSKSLPTPGAEKK